MLVCLDWAKKMEEMKKMEGRWREGGKKENKAPRGRGEVKVVDMLGVIRHQPLTSYGRWWPVTMRRAVGLGGVLRGGDGLCLCEYR